MSLAIPPSGGTLPDTVISTNSADSAARAAADVVPIYPLYLEKILLTGKDGLSKPITQVLTGRYKSGKRTRTIEGASTVEITFADPDRRVLRNPILSTGLTSVSAVATELLNDVNTLGVVVPNDNAPKQPGGSTFSQQVAHGAAIGDAVARNKQLVVQLGTNRKLPREAVVIAMMTMLDESGGVNDTTPDENGSSGVMQQTPSQGWGTRDQVNDPVYAVNTFYTRLLAVSGWQNMAPWVAAQRVQRSAWTGIPRKSNGYSSELGGNYHKVYDQALQEVQSYRPLSSSVLDTAVSNNAKGIVSVSRQASATLTYQGRDYVLVRVQTSGGDTTLTFECALVNALRRNKDPYSSGKPTSIPLFVSQLLRQSGFNPHFVQQGLVVSRVDPTGALNAGQSDPATLANFDQLLATDGSRGTGTLKVLTKFARVDTTSTVQNAAGSYDTVSLDGVVQDSWTVITGLTSPLRWIAMSDGTDFYIGSETYVSHFLDKPPIVLTENQHGVEWLSGEFDLGTETSNTMSFVMTTPFIGVPGQRVVVNDMGLLSGVWMVYSIEDNLSSAQFSVTCQRIQADLEDAEAQAVTDKLLASGGGVSTTNSGVLAGDKPQITGQASMNGWPSGDQVRADIATYTVPGTNVTLDVNRLCSWLLLYVAKQFNDLVEPLDASQCGGYAYRADVNNKTVWSNHSSGTAIDLNSARHPNNSATARTFSTTQIETIHSILKGLNGAVRWGGDYRSTVDSMHFEINTDATGVGVISAQLDPSFRIGQGHVTGGH